MEAWADDDGDADEDTGIVQGVIDSASRRIYSVIYDRYGSAADPDAYTAGDGTYPVLEDKAARLTAAMLLERQGGDEVTDEHSVLLWADEVRFGIKDIPGLE